MNLSDYNAIIASNLKSAIKAQGVTQAEVAKKASITPKTLRNMLGGGCRIDINLASEIYASLGYNPDTIMQHRKVSQLTGIPSIDQPLSAIYTQYAPSGIRYLQEYAAVPDYVCCSPQYNGWDRQKISADRAVEWLPVKTKKRDGYELWGMDLDAEIRLCAVDSASEVHMIEPLHATIISDDTIAISVRRTTICADNPAVPQPQREDLHIIYISDYLTLSHTIREITQFGSPFRIQRKIWNYQRRDEVRVSREEGGAIR